MNPLTLPALISAGANTILLLVLFARRNRPVLLRNWMLGFLGASVTWQLTLIFFPPSTDLAFIPGKLLLINTLLLGVTTARFIDWQPRLWLWAAAAAPPLTLLLDIFFPQPLVLDINTAMLPNTPGSIATFAAWLGLSFVVGLQAWDRYRATVLPSYANRLLYWTVALLLVFGGEALLIFAIDAPALAAVGHALRFGGTLSLTLAVTFHRIVDIRSRAQRALALLLVTLITALPTTLALLGIVRLADQMQPEVVLVATFGLVTLTFLLYQPLRDALERLIYRYVVGREFDTSNVVRRYSQANARTLDVRELSQVITSQIADLLGSSRGALLLVTRAGNHYDLEPIPGLGEISPETQRFPADSVLMEALTGQRQPLLQYELDFNPDYRALAPDERRWLTAQAMELYTPIFDGEDLSGIIALGPKSSGQTYRPNELDLLQILADQTVVALQNARLYSAMGRQNEQIKLLNADLRKQNERLALMDKAKADFIAIASHELRTPLTQVKGYADILDAMNEENMLTREQTRAIIGHFNRATTQLENLVSAMLDASQLDVDSMPITFTSTSLETVIRLAVEPLMGAMRERRLKLTLENLSEVPPLQVDFKRMVQAFHAVINNGVKYTPDGGRITVSAGMAPSAAGEKEYIEIVVADTGIGIDSQYHELIFGKFFRVGDSQLHSTGTTKFMGAGPGLGLPIARGVIEAHGGRIWVESDGEDMERLPGSEFHILLPREPEPRPESKNGEGPAGQSNGSAPTP